MKRSFIIFMLGLLMMFGLGGCSNSVSENETDALKFKEEYESLNGEINESNGKKYREIEIDEDNAVIYKTEMDIVEMIDNGDSFVVYFGFASCPWCRSVIETMLEVTSDLGIYPVYYVDVSDIRDTMMIDEDGNVVTKEEGTDGYYQLLEKMSTVLEDYVLTDEDGNEVLAGEKRIYAPNIVAVVDGQVMKLTDGISDSQTDAYMDLTDEMQEEAYDKIKCSIKCVADSKEVCSAKTKC